MMIISVFSSHSILSTLIFLTLLVLYTYADQKYYVNSDAAFNPGAHPNAKATSVVHSTVTLANNQFAASPNMIYITFIGQFANSGPHAFGIFSTVGQRYSFTTALEREIGEVQGVYLENQGTDNVLFQTITLRIRENVYEINVTPVWLEQLDAALDASTGNGRNPEVDIAYPSRSTQLFDVKLKYLFYDYNGLYTAD